MGWIVINWAVNRGGNWWNGAHAGPFYANLNNAPTDTNYNIGFRCCKSFKVRFMFFTEIMNNTMKLHQSKSRPKGQILK